MELNNSFVYCRVGRSGWGQDGVLRELISHETPEVPTLRLLHHRACPASPLPFSPSSTFLSRTNTPKNHFSKCQSWSLVINFPMTWPSSEQFVSVEEFPRSKHCIDTFPGRKRAMTSPRVGFQLTTMPLRNGQTKKLYCSQSQVSTLSRIWSAISRYNIWRAMCRRFHSNLLCEPCPRIYQEPAPITREGRRYRGSTCFQRSFCDERMGQGQQGSRRWYCKKLNPWTIYKTLIENLAFPYRSRCQVLEKHWLGWQRIRTNWSVRHHYRPWQSWLRWNWNRAWGGQGKSMCRLITLFILTYMWWIVAFGCGRRPCIAVMVDKLPETLIRSRRKLCCFEIMPT